MINSEQDPNALLDSLEEMYNIKPKVKKDCWYYFYCLCCC